MSPTPCRGAARPTFVNLAVATLVATLVASGLAGRAAWGHTFPPTRDVVIQVDRCEVVLLIGYRPGSGEPTEAVLARAASAPKSQAFEALRDVLTAFAVAPLTLAVDGLPLVPTAVRAKLGVEPGGGRPMVVVLVTYPLPAVTGLGGTLALTTKDPRRTRISWQDQQSGRVKISAAPVQGKWFPSVASMLLELAAPSGATTCATSPSSPSVSASSVPPVR